MKDQKAVSFFRSLHPRRKILPLDCHLELTYRCNLNCIHCYCNGSQDREKELTTNQWKKNIDLLHKEGYFFLTFSGGEPLLRSDFFELYRYAKKKGFSVKIFTNAHLVDKKLIKRFISLPPEIIEITFHGVTARTYESITQVPGSFHAAERAIIRLAENKINFSIKTSLMKQNSRELSKISAFDNRLKKLWKRAYSYFQFDGTIFPRLNGDASVCRHRIPPGELAEIMAGFDGSPNCQMHKRQKNLLYNCDVWRNRSVVDPYGYLKFCILSKEGVYLNATSFKKAFYVDFPRILLKKRFKGKSKCGSCKLKDMCATCPPRAYLETGDEESPVDYYCQLAQEELKLSRSKRWVKEPGKLRPTIV